MRILILLLPCLIYSTLRAQGPDSLPPQRVEPFEHSLDTISPDTSTQKPHPSRYLSGLHAYVQSFFFHHDPNPAIASGYFRQVNLSACYDWVIVQRSVLGPTVTFEPLGRYMRYNLRGSGTLAPDSVDAKKKWIKVYTLMVGIGNRSVFTVPRHTEGIPGFWIQADLAGFLPIYSAYGVIHEGKSGENDTKTVSKGLKPQPWVSARFRIGYGPFALLGEYRITRMFAGGSPFTDFPRFQFGICMGGQGDD